MPRSLLAPAEQLPRCVLWGALALYAAFIAYGSLLPFDYRAGPEESYWQRLLEASFRAGASRSITDWATNIALYVPLGFLAGGLVPAGARLRQRWAAAAAFFACMLLSVLVEAAQFNFPPRDPSARDVLANGIGALVGLAAWPVLARHVVGCWNALVGGHERAHAIPRPSPVTTLGGLAVWTLLVSGWAGWWTSPWLDVGSALARFGEASLLPFIHHQQASIFRAVASALLVLVIYLPMGTLFQLGRRKPPVLMVSWQGAAFGAAGLSLLIEASKLFLAAKQADSGNVIIAWLAGAVGYLLAPLLISGRALSQGAEGPRSPFVRPAWTAILLSAGCAALAGWIVATLPFGRGWVAVLALAYAVLLARFLAAWLVVLPALLPVLDLAPWTGRFFFDEFDALLLITVAAALWRPRTPPVRAPSDVLAATVFWGFLGSFFVSMCVGLFPLDPLDASALGNYFSHYNAARLAKGGLAAAALIALLRVQSISKAETFRLLSLGLTLGVLFASVSVVWERIAYAGLFDYVKNFRVAGMFSTMNTGGAHLDAFLVIALPFALGWGYLARSLQARALAAAICVAGAYSLMVTYSRAAAAALVAVLILVTAAAFMSREDRSKAVRRGRGFVIVVTILACAVGLPALLGAFMQQRLDATSRGMEMRTSHWNDVVGVMDGDLQTILFGMGLGRFPEANLGLPEETRRPTTHGYAVERGNSFLRLGAGATLYIDQIVPVAPFEEYVVSLRFRASGLGAVLHALLCERTYFYGYHCRSVTFKNAREDGAWEAVSGSLNTAVLGASAMRRVKFSLENASQDVVLDVDDVSLKDALGNDLLANGDFQAGPDRWYFSSAASHLPWHIKNVFLQLYFEQGVLGLATFTMLLALALWRAGSRAWRGDFLSGVILASLAGFVVVGVFDSVFDAPRITMMFLLLAGLAALPLPKPRAAGPPIDGAEAAAVKTHGGRSIGAGIGPPNSRPLAGECVGVEHAGVGRFLSNLAFGGVMVGAALLVATRAPFMPYNLRELPNPYHPVVAIMLLTVFVYWACAMPALIARWANGAGPRALALPLALLLHAVGAWALLHFAVLPESIHDVVGAPVLGWPGQMENALRFTTLFSVLSVGLTGGALAACLDGGRGTGWGWGAWLVTAGVLFPVQYYVIVEKAATDNLTELMANGGSVLACALLAAYALLLGVAGAFSARAWVMDKMRGLGALMLLAVVALPVGYALLAAGTADTIVKDGKSFSALQFLLSTDRRNYAMGVDLWVRFAVFQVAVLVGISFAQYPAWMLPWGEFWRSRGKKQSPGAVRHPL